MHAVDALLSCWRLTLMDMARAWPGKERVRAPLKALDRLLGNPHLHVQREHLYADMARWLLRGPQPVIIVDWSDLKANKAWSVLRAAVPVGGRTLTILDMVFPGTQQGSPAAEKHFLERLKTVIPDAATPILVTDAGFRNPWFRVVAGMGWHWIGRLRHRTLLTRPGTVMDDQAWLPSRALYALATRTPQDIGWMQMAQANPLLGRVVLYRKAMRGRHRHTCFGKVARSKVSRQAAAREREPWLIVASPELSLSARQLIKLYARRMQIELSFRDLKSHRYGQAFEDSLTRKGHRIEILLLLSALASFASWAAGLAAEAADMVDRLAPHSAKRKIYSVLRIGREAIVRQWSLDHLLRSLSWLRSLPDDVLEQMGVPA